MHTFINSPLQIGSLTLPHRLIQGPLAGYSCAPFRILFNQFTPPAYCVSEMSSAKDILLKHSTQSRYVYRSPDEKILAYQLSGNDPQTLGQAAALLQTLGADLIDLNCGCPKAKIRKKGSGSALLETPELLIKIIKTVKNALTIPLTVKIRIQKNDKDIAMAQEIEQAGADALIVHGRRWIDDYDISCDLNQIANIKKSIQIPIIANGDIHHSDSLKRSIELSGCDGFMIARAGTGKPWIYKELLEQKPMNISIKEKINLFITHLQGLADLENEHKALLQGKSLVRYYFRDLINENHLIQYYALKTLNEVILFFQNLGSIDHSLDCQQTLLTQTSTAIHF